MTLGRITPETTRLDDAARAAWLYYVAGNTQDEIARKLGVSRQSAQRLVSLAMTERLVKVRIDHPIAACMELSEALTSRYGLRLCEVVPSDQEAPDLLTGVAIAGATELERRMKLAAPQIIALGTGRALKACVEQLPQMSCPQHRIVSLLGNMMADGSATPYNATIRMADRVGARHYPYPLPVLARDREELRLLQGQDAVRHTLDLCRRADFTLVGIGQMGNTAPLFVDGFISESELVQVEAAGAVGEITSWIYDARGVQIDAPFNSRVASAPLPKASDRDVVAVAAGRSKLAAIRAALAGRLINGLITNEVTAALLLE